VVISDGIPDHIRGRLGIDFVDGGNREVKNIERALLVAADNHARLQSVDCSRRATL
jgi:hypothetical protein